MPIHTHTQTCSPEPTRPIQSILIKGIQWVTSILLGALIVVILVAIWYASYISSTNYAPSTSLLPTTTIHDGVVTSINVPYTPKTHPHIKQLTDLPRDEDPWGLPFTQILSHESPHHFTGRGVFARYPGTSIHTQLQTHTTFPVSSAAEVRAQHAALRAISYMIIVHGGFTTIPLDSPASASARHENGLLVSSASPWYHMAMASHRPDLVKTVHIVPISLLQSHAREWSQTGTRLILCRVDTTFEREILMTMQPSLVCGTIGPLSVPGIKQWSAALAPRTLVEARQLTHCILSIIEEQ